MGIVPPSSHEHDNQETGDRSDTFFCQLKVRQSIPEPLEDRITRCAYEKSRLEVGSSDLSLALWLEAAREVFSENNLEG